MSKISLSQNQSKKPKDLKRHKMSLDLQDCLKTTSDWKPEETSLANVDSEAILQVNTVQ